eukprot:TRINITY_DN743_c0_g1::TRINITY_DN743_c0_g1_i1::g.18449::m.18449 TRINITY_DN743_c0_g1::TRINITY_DN743_c0_g1_i1::g.18449  ORF type:complete len:237 (+),score=86.64,sp/Q5ZJF4/PRDX6_CHICK/60.73/3e-91,AhpC-TSA/PF00578.16/1.2e-27,Redoxin/PF08534.5/1.4e-14,1-cysPrx_C/PF10417.4/7.2e-11,AhpC-TSA_2/PF13911.1/0.13 TRINITY_DN743_c0_g1_i1:40-711(+)
MVNLGDLAPNFSAQTTHGPIDFHKAIDGSWAILFSHPADYTPVCTTELGVVAQLLPEFEKRGVKVFALSCDNVENHLGWWKDVAHHQGLPQLQTPPYPIIADQDRSIAVAWGMIDPVVKDKAGLPLTCRAVFVINPDKKVALSILYPASTGRNFDEILRVIDSVQLTAKYSVATPVNWSHGGYCMVVPSVSDDDAKAKFPKGFETISLPSGKGYIRKTPQPNL